MLHLTPCEQKAFNRLTDEWQTRKELSIEWKVLKSLVRKGFAEECTKRGKEKHPFRTMDNGVNDIRNYALLRHYRRKTE